MSISASSVSVGTTIKLTAHVTSGGVAVSPGQILFCNADATLCQGSALLAQASLTSHGDAAIAFRPGIGTYHIKAIFLGIARASSSSASSLQPSTSATQTVTVSDATKVATTTALSVPGGSGSYQLIGTVTTPGHPIPGGTVSFLDLVHSNALLGSAPITSGTKSVNLIAASTIPNVYNDVNQRAEGDFNGDGIPDLAVSHGYQPPVAILLGKGDGTFTSGTAPVSTGRNAIVAGDFNGDGILDLAAGQTIGSSPCCSVSVMLGKGDGTFNAPVDFSVGSDISELLTADFDGDGILDVVAINTINSTLTFSFGNGDGTFGRLNTITLSKPFPFPVAGSGAVPSVVLGDLNGDGIPDIATSVATDSNGGSAIELLAGAGDGTFSTSMIPVSALYCFGLAAADFNGDGHVDFAIASIYQQSLTILLANGSGGYNALPAQKLNDFTSRLYSSDFNNDGIADLVLTGTLSQGTSVTFFFGVGDGTFTRSSSPLPSLTGYTSAATIADFNSDGVPDLAIDTGDSYLPSGVFLNQPQLTVALPGSLPGGGLHKIQATYSGDSVYAASASSTVNVQNITATPQLFPPSGAYSNPVTITITDATPNAVISYTLPYSSNPGPFLYTGPFLLDESTAAPYYTEVVATAAAPGYVKSANAFEAYHVAETIALTLSFAPYASNPAGIRISLQSHVTANNIPFHDGTVIFCNADAPHCTDSAVLGSAPMVPGGWAILRRRFGPGTYHIRAEFQPQRNGDYGLGRSVGVSPVQTLISRGKAATSTATPAVTKTSGTYTLNSNVTAYGFSGLSGALTFKDSINGASPVVLGSTSLSSTSAATGLSAAIPSSAGGTSSHYAVMDFNSDGIPDMVTTVPVENRLSILQGNGDGTFAVHGTVPAPTTPTAIWAGDLNGDDRPDFVVASRDANALTVFLAQTDGSYKTGATLTTGASPQAIVVNDFNGDGYRDIACANTDGSSVSIFYGNGDGTYGTPTIISLASKPLAIVTADFNNDTLPDLATANADGTISVLLGGGGYQAGPFVVTGFNGNGNGLLAKGDFNNDGIIDLAVPTSNAIAIFLGSGNGKFTLKTSIPALGVQNLQVADFNGDLLSDLAVTETPGTESVAVLLFGAGNGTFPHASVPQATTYTADMQALDFNGDSIPDLAALNASGTTLGVSLGEQAISGMLQNVVLSKPGTHSITAIYSGNDTFAPSSGGAIAVTVP